MGTAEIKNKDFLLEAVFSELDIWEDAVNGGIDKKIKQRILERCSDPVWRDKLKEKIIRHEYHVRPPHEAQVPKDDGTMRTVYANEPDDRVLLTVVNNVLFKYCGDMVHPACVSYQTGIGCGKIDRHVVERMRSLEYPPDKLGYKIDLSKYFDSVPLPYIEQVFDEVEKRLGPSAVLDFVREYYRSDVLLDLDRNEIHKFTSLRQGCAIAAFLADAVLYDIDDAISGMGVLYCRYSDDILVLGKGADAAFLKLGAMLEERSLALNPKKVEILDKDHWFTFLGFSIRGDNITLSKKRVKNLQKEIEALTVKYRSKDYDSAKALRRIACYLYDSSVTKYAYADGILPVINVKADIEELDRFIMDCLRACDTGKGKVGGLGYDKAGKRGVITRGTGRNVAMNRKKVPVLPDYVPLSHMRALYLADREAYAAMSKEMALGS